MQRCGNGLKQGPVYGQPPGILMLHLHHPLAKICNASILGFNASVQNVATDFHPLRFSKVVQVMEQCNFPKTQLPSATGWNASVSASLWMLWSWPQNNWQMPQSQCWLARPHAHPWVMVSVFSFLQCFAFSSVLWHFWLGNRNVI